MTNRQPPRAANTAAIPTQTPQRQGPRHLGFVETAQKGGIELLLEGDSITDWWIEVAGQDCFNKYFGKYKTANFAISGDTTQGVLWGLQNGESQGPSGFQPRAIMLMIGTNNLASNTAAEIAEGIEAIVVQNRNDFPNAKILLLGVFPCDRACDPNRGKIRRINQIISQLSDQKQVSYMDIGDKFLDPTGEFLPGAFMDDKLHPLKKGYEIWGDAIKDTLAELMK
jgi:lysophospholipase L1-like esterase